VALEQKLGDAVVVLFGTKEGQGSESFHSFRQENYFYYLSGYDEPDAVLILAPPDWNREALLHEQAVEVRRELLFLPPRNLEEERWRGPRPDPLDTAISQETGFPSVKTAEQFAETFQRLAERHKAVYTLFPERHASEAEKVRLNADIDRLRKLLPTAEIKDVRPALNSLRQVKSPSELKLIEQATGCTMKGLQAAGRELHQDLFEYEIAALLKYTFERNGCRGLAFDPIVGSGIRSTILHYTKSSARMESGDLVVVDVGAEYAHYASDVTRTLPVNGRFTPRQREVYEIVLGAQNAAIQAIKPGMKITGRTSDSLYQIAYNYINTHGKDLHGAPLGKYFTHGLSHHVGLDVHDPGEFGRPLEPGMVITIEPGIYLPEEKIGVRIEDMALVTKDGYVLLTGKLPREPDEIENWLKK